VPCPEVAAAPGDSTKVPAGIIISLTGELSSFGVALRQGIEMAEGEGAVSDLAFSYEDDGSGNRAMTVGALQSLIKRKQIRFVVVSGITNLVPIDQIIRQDGILALSALDSNATIETLSPTSFGFGWSNELTGEEMGRFARKDLKLRTAAVVVGHDEWSEIMGAGFTKAFKADGGEIISEQSVDLTDTDFRALATKIARARPDAVYFPLYGPALLPFVKQMKQSGYTGAMLSAEGITAVEIEQLGQLAEGMYSTSAYLSDPSFEERYLKKFKFSRVEVNLAYVALGYDIARFLQSCVQHLREGDLEPTTANLLMAARSVELNGILGPVSFRTGKGSARRQFVMAVKSGVLTLRGTP
jgi:branched-chain amino acid transport system substrate-binding protein